MRTAMRIVSGTLRGRKIVCEVSPDLRPTPDRVREALFSILGNAIPGRAFYDVFAGTGIVGLEALSRGGGSAVFVERDFRVLAEIERHLKLFKLPTGRVIRADVYRWLERWQPPAEAVNVFLSPPFPDLRTKPAEMLSLLAQLQTRLHGDSVVVLQAEDCELLAQLPDPERWDRRKYGRNHLLIWVKEVNVANSTASQATPASASTDETNRADHASE
jgi:16S rRNA (guanine(966)-N(2))-methyltransferase RsmD